MPPRYRRKRKTYKKAKQSVSVPAITKALSTLAEKKFVDLLYTCSPDSGFLAVNQFKDISIPSQGTGDTNRIGDSITPTSLELRVQMNTSVGGAKNTIRMVVFQWHPDNSSSAPSSTGAAADNFMMPGGNGTVFMPLSPFTVDRRRNFSVLSDRLLSLDDGGGHGQNISWHQTIKLSKKIHFNNGTLLGKNHIYIALVSNETTIVGSFPLVNVYTRLRYLDM